MGESGPGPGAGPSRRVVEVATAVIVAVVVASGVVAVGVVTRDDPESTADPEASDSLSEEPDSTATDTAEPEDSPKPEEQEEPTDDESRDEHVDAEVTEVELGVDQHEYTGPCPVVLEFQARVTTNTGPVRVDLEWRDSDSNEVEGEFVQFGGPGPDAEPVPQGADVTHEVEVTDDATVQRTVAAIDPNEVVSNTVEATVTCTPHAEITKGGDDFDAGVTLCHTLHFGATITVPHDMTVTYEWLRSDGATGPDPAPLVFGDGGRQTQSIPGQEWSLGDHEGEFGYRLHIIEPHDVTTGPVAYELNGCSGPAS